MQKADYPHGIPECGTDALRFALVAYTSQGQLPFRNYFRDYKLLGNLLGLILSILCFRYVDYNLIYIL